MALCVLQDVSVETTVSPRLEFMPAEIMAIVCDYLHKTDDIFSLRSSCRRICDTSLYSFAKRFFTAIRFMLHPLSLEALREISQHEGLAPYIQQITIGTDQLTQRDPKERLFSGKELVRQRAYMRLLNEQNAMELQCYDVALLADVFSRLTNIQVIHVTNRVESKVLDSHKNQHSWGMRKIQRETGFHFPDLDVTYPVSEEASRIRAYDIVFRAMDLALGISKVKLNITIDLRWCDRQNPTDSPRGLNCWDMRSGAWKHTALPKLHELQIGSYLNRPWEDWFITSSPNLKNLMIINWKAANDSRLRSTSFPQLSSVRLEGGEGAINDIVTFLRNHSNSLRRICIRNWSTEYDSWVPALREMQTMPHLTSLHLSNISGAATRTVLTVNKREHEGLVDWHGSEISHKLGLLANEYNTISLDIQGRRVGPHYVDFRAWHVGERTDE